MVAGESSPFSLWAALIEVNRRVMVAALRGFSPSTGLASEAEVEGDGRGGRRQGFQAVQVTPLGEVPPIGVVPARRVAAAFACSIY